MGVFFFKPCVKEITLKDGSILLKAKLLGNCKYNNVGQIPLFQLPAVGVQNHAILLAAKCVI